MVLYIDVYFLENFIFDFLLVLLSERLAGERARLLRCALAALAGAAYAVLVIIKPAAGSIFLRIPVLALMALAAGRFYSAKAFLKRCLIFFITFSSSGGAAYALALLSGGSALNGFIYFDRPIFYALAGIGITAVTVIFAGTKMRRRSEIIELSVLKDGKVYHLTAIYDSGNRARDPVTGLDIIVAEDIFTEEIHTSSRKMKIHTASGEGELLLFVPDRLAVNDSGALFTYDAAIGITDKRLSGDRSFNALIGGAFFERAQSHTGAFKEHIK